MNKNKIKEWVERYWFAVIVALIVTMISANIFRIWIHNTIIIPFLIAWVDTVVFYGLMAYKDLKDKRHLAKTSFRVLLKQFKEMIVEFGPAEYVDAMLRPFYFAIFPIIISNFNLAIFIGYVIAEITYFIPTIILYETRKRMFRP